MMVYICKMLMSPANFFIFQHFDFWGFRGGGVKGQKMTYNYQFQYVLLYISGTVDHTIEILIMISTGIFLYFFLNSTMQIFKLFCFLLAHLNRFFNNYCFWSSSVNAKKKFWGVPHLVHICAIFYLKKLCSSFLWMGFNCLKATKSLRGDSSLFTTKSPEPPGTYLIDLVRIKDCLTLESPIGFKLGTLGLGIQHLNH